MFIAVGSKNEVKVLAVKEALQDLANFSRCSVVAVPASSEVSSQPNSLQETILGAKKRAENAFNQCDCKYSFGIEGGLMEAPGTLSGYLNISACCIYDGVQHHIGLSSGFEIPHSVLENVINKKMDLEQACFHAGITHDREIGSKEGLIGILSKGKTCRKEYCKEAVVSALFQLENGEFYALSSPIKAVIFDCDGTLVDSEEFHYLSWKEAFKRKGFLLEKEYYLNNFTGVCDLDISKRSLELLGIDCYEELLASKNEFFESYQKSGIPSLQATVEFAKRLFETKNRLGLKLAVASAARKKEIISNLKSLKIEHYFDVVLSGRDDLSEYKDPEGVNKPKPYVYLKAAKMLGVKPEECVAIEDSSVGVSSAVRAGCFTVAVPNYYTQTNDLSQAHIKISSFDGISLADFFKMYYNRLKLNQL